MEEESNQNRIYTCLRMSNKINKRDNMYKNYKLRNLFHIWKSKTKTKKEYLAYRRESELAEFCQL